MCLHSKTQTATEKKLKDVRCSAKRPSQRNYPANPAARERALSKYGRRKASHRVGHVPQWSATDRLRNRRGAAGRSCDRFASRDPTTIGHRNSTRPAPIPALASCNACSPDRCPALLHPACVSAVSPPPPLAPRSLRSTGAPDDVDGAGRNNADAITDPHLHGPVRARVYACAPARVPTRARPRSRARTEQARGAARERASGARNARRACRIV